MSKTAKDFDTKELIESEIKFAFLNLTHIVEKKASLFWHIKSFWTSGTDLPVIREDRTRIQDGLGESSQTMLC